MLRRWVYAIPLWSVLILCVAAGAQACRKKEGKPAAEVTPGHTPISTRLPQRITPRNPHPVSRITPSGRFPTLVPTDPG
jgi:hypothetical protein